MRILVSFTHISEMHEQKGALELGIARRCGLHEIEKQISSECEKMSKSEIGCSGISVSDVVIAEGVLLFCDADISEMFDACIWLETDMHRF